MHLNFRLEEFGSFFCNELIISYSHWCLSTSSLKLLQIFQVSFILSDPQICRIFCVPSVFQVRWDRNQSNSSTLKSLNVGYMFHSSLCPLRDRLLYCISLCLLYCALWCSNKPLSTLLFFSSNQTSRICWVSSALWDKQDRNQSLGKPLENLEHCKHTPTFSLPRENPGVGSFHPLILYWAKKGGDGKWLLQTIAFGFWPDAFSCQHLDSGKTEAGPLDSPSKKSECYLYDLDFFQIKARNGRFFQIV